MGCPKSQGIEVTMTNQEREKHLKNLGPLCVKIWGALDDLHPLCVTDPPERVELSFGKDELDLLSNGLTNLEPVLKGPPPPPEYCDDPLCPNCNRERRRRMGLSL